MLITRVPPTFRKFCTLTKYQHQKADFLKMNCTRIVRHTLTIRGAFFMVKFSPEEKIQSVKEYLNGNDGGKTIANSIGVHHSVLHQWIKQYEIFGEDTRKNHQTRQSAGSL
ncbi:transposase [Bacillus sp. OV166]|uniref:transposase n=1 Tax=Bacillus sp. OV166 TaxID=1882763 RepID=UPI00277D0A09|nr:transposase [Bacillus sp. OV166]